MNPILNNYDFIIIDTLPSLGILLLNALTAANGVIIPISADRDSLQGLGQLSQTIEATRKYTNPELKIYGILVTMLFSNTTLSKEIVSDILPEIEKQLCTQTFKNKIRYTTKVKDAKAKRISIYDYAPNSTAAKDYEAVTGELIQRIEELSND